MVVVPSPEVLTRADGATIAYNRTEGKGVGVVFLHGLMSDRNGGKALAVEAWCRKTERPCLRLDLFGHGESSGDFVDGTVGRWAEDAVAALDALTEGPQVVVGSSMGGWVMLLVALARPERVKGLLGIAPAPDFTEDLMWRELSAAQRETMARDGVVEVPSAHGPAPYRIARRLIEDGRERLLLGGSIAFSGPVRILQGMKDDSVPWETALRLQSALTSEDVEVTLIKNGDHRLSEPADIARLERTLDGLAARVEDGL